MHVDFFSPSIAMIYTAWSTLHDLHCMVYVFGFTLVVAAAA